MAVRVAVTHLYVRALFSSNLLPTHSYTAASITEVKRSVPCLLLSSLELLACVYNYI